MKPIRRLIENAIERFIELEGIDRSMALAGQAFAALLPLMIVIASLSPTGGADLSAGLVSTFHLRGSSAESLRAAVAQPPEQERGISSLSFVILLVSSLSFTRALQRLYVRAWRLPALGWRGNVHGLAWIVGLTTYLGLLPVVASLVSGAPAVGLHTLAGVGLWLATPWILLGRRLPWTVLLPQAMLTAVSMSVLSVGSALWMPRAVASASEQFGTIGVAFALLSWLLLAGGVLVGAAAMGAVAGQGDGVNDGPLRVSTRSARTWHDRTPDGSPDAS